MLAILSQWSAFSTRKKGGDVYLGIYTYAFENIQKKDANDTQATFASDT